ncbi:carbohydrate ABC transporter permease [Parasphaerochaeta coccoides]|uniref:Carbohydrate ABC transporter membrane protein 2, CUT1 family n=1 Tax=Parasphaerochaeta coccoides (strain ATCC BAA-1237 / DSM 17374 / SPN1) TaxID=760011 RepID=F4GIS0_PARC1|nr:carbohydrate ABC transporter permease [Parasphaerochaeta coccoides]AEC02688.1 carbohydrate ABC transporter membrane protein 2, CUT1 family [Parasphaerochaeta coccoides DSM 17374]
MKIRKLHILTHILLITFGLAMLFPFFWMIATSFKQGRAVFNLSLIPTAPTTANYVRLMTSGHFSRWFINSLICGILVTFSVLFFDSLVGYTFAKYKFRGKKLIFLLILSTMMIPTEMLVIPWYIMANNLKWANTYWGIIFPGLMSGFGTFLMRQFFDGLPNDLIDAGRIDGLNEFSIWVRVCMPLVKAALSALAIFSFVGNWNAFLWPLIISDEITKYTLPVGLSFFNGEFQTEWEMVMAGASVATIPVLVLYLIFQKQIIKGIALTGVKG